MKQLISLLFFGILVFSTAAAAMTMNGDLTTSTMMVNQLKKLENKYRQACHFTNQGVICPETTPTSTALLKRQGDIAPTTPLPPRSPVATERMTKRYVRNYMPSTRSKSLVDKMEGTPGGYSKWATRRVDDNTESCYITSQSGASGNMVCPGFMGVGTFGSARARKDKNEAFLKAHALKER